jgi:hypothetical protein
MIATAYDPTTSSLVVLDSLPKSDDADYERAVAAVAKLAEESNAAGQLATFLMIVDDGAQAPSADWRRRFADAELAFRKLDMVFVTRSAIARGVITAVRWLAGPRDGVWHQTQETVPGAIALLEKRRGARLPHLTALHEDCRRSLR